MSFNIVAGIILMSSFENAMGIASMILMMIAFAAGFQWIMAKFFGVKTHGRFGVHRAFAEIEQDKQDLSTHLPEDIAEGIRRCERKGYVKTHTNVLAEVRQLIREREHRTTGDSIKKKGCLFEG